MHPFRIPHSAFRTSPRRAMTLLEVMIASTLSSLLAIGLMSLTISAGRLNKALSSQQNALHEAQSAIEHVNREIRLATTPLVVVDAGGNPVLQADRVEFARLGEAPRSRALELLPGDDGDITTPWDNTLIYDPDTAVGGDEVVIADWLIPLELAGPFRYEGATAPLIVQMRVGDPQGLGDLDESNTRTGPGIQGVEINLAVAPRN